MATFEAKLTSKGQITLPVSVRTRLGIETGDKVFFTETADGCYRLKAQRPSMRDLKGIVKTGRKLSSEEIARWIDEARGKAAPASVVKRLRRR